MAFTNIWDDTFPTDTELANLIGANLRQLRVDTQQRMAAITGLDAAKPAFQSDTQPASWVGILFFATDTGKVYRFINPGWQEVTGIVVSSRTLGILPGNMGPGQTIFGTPTNASATEANIQFPLPVAANFRALYVRTNATQPASGGVTVTLRKNGVSSSISVVVGANAPAGTYNDLAHTSLFNPGDLLTVQMTNNGSVGNTTLAGMSVCF